MAKSKKPLNDGYTLPDHVPEVSLGKRKVVVAPAFDVTYRPALPRESNAWALMVKDTGDQLTDGMIDFILDHLKSWTLTQAQLQPWLYTDGASANGSTVAEISRDNLELVDPRQLSRLVDIFCRYVASGQDEEDSKN